MDDEKLFQLWTETYHGEVGRFLDEGGGFDKYAGVRALRQALFDELIGDAYGESFCALVLHCDTGSFGGSEYLGTLIDWLKARKEATNGQA